MNRWTYRGRLALASLCIPVLVGCATKIRLREIDDATWFKRENRNALDSSKPSERTLQYLRREGGQELYEDDSREVLHRLHKRLMEKRDRAVAFHLAELCYREAERADEVAQTRYYLSSAYYAYAYLFDENLGDPPSAYDPSFRWVCDFYNRSLARVISNVRGEEEGPREKRERIVLPLLEGEIEVTLGVNEHEFEPYQYSEVLIGFNYETVGLPGSARAYGLGVPLILVQASLPEGMVFKPLSLAELAEDEDSPEVEVRQSYSSTAILRFKRSVIDDGNNELRSASLELYDPTKTSFIEIGEQRIPLEVDVTSSLAYSLRERTRSGFSGLTGLFKADDYVNRTGLLMFQPYDPEKIPVVFVHGLMSSPMTWMKLFNDLLADPELRHRYQFWFFRYPTGNPIGYSGSLLRETLLQVAQAHDPDGNNPAFRRMVVCGHSMGGLVSKLQILEGGNRYWKLISDEPIEDLNLNEAEEELLRRIIYFERLPFVKRMIFMATPHRGADLATSWIGRLGARFVNLPKTLYEGSLKISAAASERLRERFGDDVSGRTTGIAGLRSDSVIAVEMCEWPLPPEVPIHTICGNEEAADTPGGSDGLVHYESSHLDGVQSEMIVKSDHHVQENPFAILELRRILKRHLAEYDAR